MTEQVAHPVAIVGISAIMPDAPDADTFWSNITGGRYSVSDVPVERWDPELYYDADPHAPDKTYSRIGGWVKDFPWDPVAWKLPVPPTVAKQMDDGQRWAVSAARAALVDAGWPNWGVDSEKVAVILGNAIGGEKHYRSSLRIEFPEFAKNLRLSPAYAALADDVRTQILDQAKERFLAGFTEINEDTMPGELANVIAGRVANLFNFRGPNFTTDAACASGLAAMSAAVDGLVEGHYDAVISGGVDRNMGVAAFVKFCKIGALSATGTRPFDAGADGFVMGEGASLFVLRRLADAERDGNKIYAVLVGLAGASDGKGKGITAPNPIGQRLAVERAWQVAGLDPATAGCVEAHGTSTRVGDATELASLTEVFAKAGAAPGSIALGSVKSNIGHLKAAAGTAGLFKMVRSLHEKVLTPSLNFRTPNENVDWPSIPFRVNTELREWPAPADGVRRGGVSAFGFGGTNFHAVLEEYVPGRYRTGPRSYASAAIPSSSAQPVSTVAVGAVSPAARPPMRGALVVGGRDASDVVAQLRAELALASSGQGVASAPPVAPDPALADAPLRVAIDFADAGDLATKLGKTVKAFEADTSAMWRMLRSQGVFVGRSAPDGSRPKVAFLYTGQGSQYVNMLQELRSHESVVADTFDRADAVMTPLLGRPLSSYIFVDGGDPDAVKQLEKQLRQTEITQPAVLATDYSLSALLGAYGVVPDMVMGHSLGEYGALVAAGSLTFEAALEAVSARGREMAALSMGDNGKMAAVFGPLDEIERVVDEVNAAGGYVVIANINSLSQAVIGGASTAVEQAVAEFGKHGINAVLIPVSHAFHTSIVAPASVPLVEVLRRLDVRPPTMPIVANVTGEFYPADATTDTMLEMLGRQVASPVQFVKGLRTLYDAGARVFVEVGPKKALHGFVDDVLVPAHDDVLALFTNHPKLGDVGSVNQALCGLWSAGLAFGPPRSSATATAPVPAAAVPVAAQPVAAQPPIAQPPVVQPVSQPVAMSGDRYEALGHLFAEVLDRGMQIYAGADGALAASPSVSANGTVPLGEPVVVTGAALGLPGVDQVFDDENVGRILAGQQFIDSIPHRYRQRMVDMHITRLVKSEATGPAFETIQSEAEVIKLAGRHAPLDIVEQFGIDASRDEALDVATRLAIGAGFDALRDAGIPLVMRYKTTTLGTQLPDRWGLADSMRDDTGVIFASAFPGYESFAAELEAYFTHRGYREQLLALEAVRARLRGDESAATEIDRRIAELRHEIDAHPYTFDRRFLFRCLAMGHSQFAEIIGARGPNTQINAACASTTQAVGMAQDWIRTGRCRRVVVVSADDATADHLMPWITSGFLASGAAATDDVVADAATPFDRRRHGMIVGMGAAALVVESADAARERGIRPICEVLGAVTANSAFHGTRLDIDHIAGVMESVVRQAEARGVQRHAIAASTVFVSHETYTPARGGSAAAEINALRSVFGADADSVVITNTKGFTGHAMGAGIEDVVAVKALETGVVPPVPNYREPDPTLGNLNLSTGGSYDVRYALRLAAGFGSQVAMSLVRWTPMPDGRRRLPSELGYAYRIVDPAAWQRWIDGLAGSPGARVEVVQRRLRVVDAGAPGNGGAVGAGAVVPQAITQPVRTSAPARSPALAPAQVPAQVPTRVPTQVPAAVPAVGTAPVTVPVQAAPVAVSSVAVAPPPVADPVVDAVLGIVADMTGYPPELLDLDLDLEADLGVDTVKQAEVFAAVRSHFDVERDENLRLREFPTLTHVIGWVRDKTGIAPTAPQVHDHAELDAVPAPVTAPAAATVPPTVVQAPTPTSTSAPEPAPAGSDEVMDAVVGIVSGMTGYPVELLDPELDLEADLGVDTVKQAEVFAAVRERFGVERDPNLQLRDFPTLNHVVGWVRSKTGIAAPTAPELHDQQGVDGTVPIAAPAVAPPAVAAVAPPAAPAAGPVTDDVMDVVVGIVAGMTGYPAELLDPELDLEADLGVDTVKQAEVFAAVREHYGVERDPNLQLRDFPTLNLVAGWVRSKTGIAAPTAPELHDHEEAQGAAPAAVPATAPTAPPAAPAAGSVTDDVMDVVVGIVAGMTGYPAELLDPELDLEADLGVDTVKQAEVFAAVREHYGVERDPNLQLRDFPTLNLVAGWVRSKIGAVAPSAAPAPETSAAPGSHDHRAVGGAGIVGDLAAIDALPRRVPVPVLRPALDVCAATGVDLAGSRIVVMLDEGGVGDALVKRLRKAGAEPLTLAAGVSTDDLAAHLDEWLADGPVAGVFWLAALDDEGPLEALDLVTWREALRRRVKTLYTTMRRLYTSDAFLVTGTRLGGYHGYDAAGATAPLGGAVTGFAKSYKRERPAALVKAVDLPASRKTAALADVLIEEVLRDPGCVEIGRPEPGSTAATRWGVGLAVQPFTPLRTGDTPAGADASGEGGVALGRDSVVLVTGAAGSIVSAITADLATASGGTFHLLDLTPEPDPADPDLARFGQDRDGLKADLAARLKERGDRPTPVAIEKELARIERLAAALSAVRAVEAAGGTAHYHSVDLTDPVAVQRVLDVVREQADKVDLLLHAAGLEISRALPDKAPHEYDLVFDVKSDGWFNVLHAAGDLPIGATVAFSSVAGRFGNSGQTDYSAANDLLCKITSSLRRTRPWTRGLALDWTAWGGIGMATRGSIPKIMEMAGVQMLPPQAGIAWIRRELASSAFSGEVVVAGRLGMMAAEPGDDAGHTAGLDLDVAGGRLLATAGPLTGSVVSAGVVDGFTVRTTLDPVAQPFLDDHRIDGIPVLPGVMGMEAFAEAARAVVRLCTPTSTPAQDGWRVAAVEDVGFDAPLKFYRDEPRELTTYVMLTADGDDLVARCRLEAERTLPGNPEPQRTVHFRGSVRLVRGATPATDGGEGGDIAPVPAEPSQEAVDLGRELDPEVIYRLYFHGPAYQVVAGAWRSGDAVVGRFQGHLGPNHAPQDLLTVTGPRLVELCFQTAGLWEAGVAGQLALPRSVDAVRLVGAVEGAIEGDGPIHAVVTARSADGEAVFDAYVVDAKGRVLLRLDGYRTIALPSALPPETVEPLRLALHG